MVAWKPRTSNPKASRLEETRISLGSGSVPVSTGQAFGHWRTVLARCDGIVDFCFPWKQIGTWFDTSRCSVSICMTVNPTFPKVKEGIAAWDCGNMWREERNIKVKEAELALQSSVKWGNFIYLKLPFWESQVMQSTHFFRRWRCTVSQGFCSFASVFSDLKHWYLDPRPQATPFL